MLYFSWNLSYLCIPEEWENWVNHEIYFVLLFKVSLCSHRQKNRELLISLVSRVSQSFFFFREFFSSRKSNNLSIFLNFEKVWKKKKLMILSKFSSHVFWNYKIVMIAWYLYVILIINLDHQYSGDFPENLSSTILIHKNRNMNQNSCNVLNLKQFSKKMVIDNLSQW